MEPSPPVPRSGNLPRRQGSRAQASTSLLLPEGGSPFPMRRHSKQSPPDRQSAPTRVLRNPGICCRVGGSIDVPAWPRPHCTRFGNEARSVPRIARGFLVDGKKSDPNTTNQASWSENTKGGCDEIFDQEIPDECCPAVRLELDRGCADAYGDDADCTELRHRDRRDHAGAQARRLANASPQLPKLGL